MRDEVKPAMYVRVGRGDEDAQAKADRQSASCRAYASRLGWPQPIPYVDIGVSQAPAFRALAEDVVAGAVTHVVLDEFDRLPRPRSLRDLEGVDIHSAAEGRMSPEMLRVLNVVFSSFDAKVEPGHLTHTARTSS